MGERGRARGKPWGGSEESGLERNSTLSDSPLFPTERDEICFRVRTTCPDGMEFDKLRYKNK